MRLRVTPDAVVTAQYANFPNATTACSCAGPLTSPSSSTRCVVVCRRISANASPRHSSCCVPPCEGAPWFLRNTAKEETMRSQKHRVPRHHAERRAHVYVESGPSLRTCTTPRPKLSDPSIFGGARCGPVFCDFKIALYGASPQGPN